MILVSYRCIPLGFIIMRTTPQSLFLALAISCGLTLAQEQSCHTRCVSDCNASCPDPKVCSENEVDCGEGPPHPSGFCEADRVCVAKDCLCKH